MFKLFFFIFLINCCPIVAEMAEAPNINVEIRSGAFFHSSKRFREIYGNVGGSYQLEASTRLCNCWNGWANLDWFSDHGKSKECKVKTNVNVASLSFGLKYPYQFCERYIAYVGIGPCISKIWLKNRSQFEHEKVSKSAVGGVLKTGICYFITCSIFLDVFVDYLYQPVHFEKRVDIGGIKAGIGVGSRF